MTINRIDLDVFGPRGLGRAFSDVLSRRGDECWFVGLAFGRSRFTVCRAAEPGLVPVAVEITEQGNVSARIRIEGFAPRAIFDEMAKSSDRVKLMGRSLHPERRDFGDPFEVRYHLTLLAS